MRKFFYTLLFIFCLIFPAKSQENQVSPSVVENPDSLKFTIVNLGETINTPYDEYAPVISADGEMMIFTSRRPIFKEDISKKMAGMENIYVSYYDDMTWKWSEAKMLGPTVNQPWKNNSAIALSNDGQRMLLYRGDPDGDIYESDLVGDEWSEAVKLPKPINSKSHESSASISPDGRSIYFISNRKGGQGKLDIWVCHQDNLGWGKAENLGPTINTPQDEEGVFIHPDGKTLYFSSKGHNSLGGYDIFKSVLENGKWSEPVNLGDSINTHGDDLFFNITANGKTGYYSSARDGGFGKKDIYEINFKKRKKEPKLALLKKGHDKPKPPAPDAEITNNNSNEPKASDRDKFDSLYSDVEITNNDNTQPNLTLFKGIVIDYDSFNPLGSDIEITDNDKNKVITTIKSNSVTGKFLASLPAGKNYGLSINKKGYVFYSENIDIPASAAYKEIHKHIPLQKLTVGSRIVLKNIFYDYGKSTLRPESVSELFRLVKLLSLSIDLKIELAAYTDSDGSDEFNLALSQKRAQSVVDFLYAAGISRDQLIAKGYGKANPVATNATEAGRQLNRRTEIKVLEQ